MHCLKKCLHVVNLLVGEGEKVIIQWGNRTIPGAGDQINVINASETDGHHVRTDVAPS